MDPVVRLLETARISLAKTNYEQALEAYFKADALLPVEDFIERVGSQLAISETYLAKGSPEQAEQHARQALAIWQSSGGDKPLNQLFKAYSLVIKSLAAQKKHVEVVSAVSSVARSPMGELAKFKDSAISMLGTGYSSALALKDNESAITFMKLSLELCKLGIEQNQSEGQLNNANAQVLMAAQQMLGITLTSAGKHEEAIEILREAVEEAKRRGDENRRNDLLVALGFALVMGKHPLEGVTMLANVIEKLEDSSQWKDLGLTSLNLGYTVLGERAKAEEASARLLQIAVKAGNYDRALPALQQQASDLLKVDRLIEAKQCLENAIRALERYPDKFHEDRFLAMTLLAQADCRLWDFQGASRALDDAWILLPKATSHVSSIDSNLTFAGYCSVAADYAERLSMWDAQLKWALLNHSIKVQHAEAHPLLVAESWRDLGRAYIRVRDFPKAFACLASAKSEVAKLPHTNFNFEWNLLDIFALAYSEQGDLESAIRIREQLLDLVSKKSGKTNGLYFHTLKALAEHYIRKRDFQKASEMCVEGQLLFAEHAWRDTAFLPTGQRGGWNLAGMILPRFACLAALSATNQISARNAALVSAMSKGLETEVWSAQAMLSTNQSVAAARQLVEEYWSNRGTAETGSKAYKLRGEVSAALQTLFEGSRMSFDVIRNSISVGAVLVDFAMYWRCDFNDTSAPYKEDRYAAFLTFPPTTNSTNVVVERVDLGEAAPINEAVELVCRRMSAGQFAAKDLSPALQRLGQLVYAPLAPYLTNVSHLIVCPDGQLSRLPFEMLSVRNRFLVEEKTISYVTSGREVVRIACPQSRGQSPQSKAGSSKSLVMGNPDFDFDLASRRRREEALTKTSQHSTNDSQPGIEVSLLTSSPTRALSRDYRGLKFNPLPGSGIEATNVARLLGESAVLQLGAGASKANLKAVVSPRVLHLATHGFFLPDQEFKRTNALRDSFIGNLGMRWNASSPQDQWENPLVRCGIALAGANHYWPITNAWPADGSLTGLEASLLNLQGTELVILSACDSGTGEVKIGEGVMSLRRAFRIAGAETVLASHWKVSDKATSQLMTEFMRRWRAGEPRAKAWRGAQLTLLRSKGAKEDFSNPFFWAAFTLTGQWN